MIHAYDKQYLDDAMRNLGEAFEYAGNNCGIELDDFMDVFIAEGIADQFGSGVPKFVSGMSGTELVWVDISLLSMVHRQKLQEHQTAYLYAGDFEIVSDAS